MDENRALNKILECADLVAMLEDLSAAAARGAVSASGNTGIRLTLRGIREQLLGCHDILAKAVSPRSRANENNIANAAAPSPQSGNSFRDSISANNHISDFAPGSRPANAIGPDSNSLSRRDLRAMIEKGMES